jgi:hypothetical protein
MSSRQEREDAKAVLAALQRGSNEEQVRAWLFKELDKHGVSLVGGMHHSTKDLIGKLNECMAKYNSDLRYDLASPNDPELITITAEVTPPPVKKDSLLQTTFVHFIDPLGLSSCPQLPQKPKP